MSIANDIRRAAMEWPAYLSVQASAILLHAEFCSPYERYSLLCGRYDHGAPLWQAYMLFVAEALDGGTISGRGG